MRSDVIFSLLAGAFLNRLDIKAYAPVYSSRVKQARHQTSMEKLFTGVQLNKLRCLVNCFYFGLTNPALISNRNLTFVHSQTGRGKLLQYVTDFNPVEMPLATNLTHNIEDIPGAIWADFANKRFGGGVFNKGQVQEEI
ncbi:hypothetical protein PoB_006006800 [Plakobranchus ocellatus]|uniref:PARG catalytic Macro domain-containing protein n=1 Tax=Plakobranchus ocellatus TaxID=259542 RepID=A0AAV4CNU1_9GAST|nr:hypothetical protein PoB_006006800 [Plakobranchus ocellatus]